MPNPSKKRPPAVDGDSESAGPAKKVKQSDPESASSTSVGANAATSRGADDNDYWELSGMRRIVISDFKGKTMVGIREYYEKDGKALPGKKGISLPVEQFAKLIALLPQIEDALGAKGESLPRPAYSTTSETGARAADRETHRSTGPKQNFEETSEEDD